MTRLSSLVAAVALLGACSFDGHPGTGDGPDVDGRSRDARVDAPPGTPDGRADASPDAMPLTCPGYVTLGTSPTLYRVVDSPTEDWATAAADCNDDDDGGGFAGFTHLAVIGDEEERLTITPQFSGNRWVGLTDAVVENVFVWVTLEPTGGYEAPGNEPPWPSNQPAGGTADNCVRFNNGGRFDDRACNEKNKYLCECDAFPPL